jgi:hypothetical protein
MKRHCGFASGFLIVGNRMVDCSELMIDDPSGTDRSPTREAEVK